MQVSEQNFHEANEVNDTEIYFFEHLPPVDAIAPFDCQNEARSAIRLQLQLEKR